MSKTLVSIIESEGEFNFRLDVYTPLGVTPLPLYEEPNRDILLSRRDNLERFAMIVAAVVAPSLLPFKLKSSKAAALYNPPENLKANEL